MAPKVSYLFMDLEQATFLFLLRDEQKNVR